MRCEREIILSPPFFHRHSKAFYFVLVFFSLLVSTLFEVSCTLEAQSNTIWMWMRYHFSIRYSSGWTHTHIQSIYIVLLLLKRLSLVTSCVCVVCSGFFMDDSRVVLIRSDLIVSEIRYLFESYNLSFCLHAKKCQKNSGWIFWCVNLAFFLLRHPSHSQSLYPSHLF